MTNWPLICVCSSFDLYSCFGMVISAILHRCCSWLGLFNCFPPLGDCIVFSGTMAPRLQERDLQEKPKINVINKAHFEITSIEEAKDLLAQLFFARYTRLIVKQATEKSIRDKLLCEFDNVIHSKLLWEGLKSNGLLGGKGRETHRVILTMKYCQGNKITHICFYLQCSVSRNTQRRLQCCHCISLCLRATKVALNCVWCASDGGIIHLMW